MDLLAADPQPKFCRIVRTVAVEQRGNAEAKKHYDRLRKKYDRMKKRGELPRPSPQRDRRAEQIRAMYRQRATVIEQGKRDLAEAQERARFAGIDLNGDLAELQQSLEQERDRLRPLVRAETWMIVQNYRNKGVEDPEEVIRQVAEDEEKLREIEGKLALLSELSRLGGFAGTL